MKKKLIAGAIIALLATTGCSPKQQTEGAEQTAAQSGQAELGSFGVELDARDLSVKPGDDFFMHAGGTWYKNYELPADKTRYGAFGKLAERSEERVKAIIDELASKDDLTGEAKLVADFYNAYMDTETINSKGITPIQPILDEIAAIENVSDLTTLFGKAWLTDTATPIWGGMWYDRLDPNRYELNVGVGGLGLPDRDYYLVESERFANIRAEYEKHIAEMLTFTGAENPAEQAKAILALETKIAEIQWPREKRR
ncbi:MAG: M13 family peptidase, partial [Gammaproteobacteria bacterium]|nr:M13 family peptidase [Gammaproteobacteria bacterium]